MNSMPVPKSFLSAQFDRARLKLTLIYLAISGCIVIIFSFAALNTQHYAVDRLIGRLQARAQANEREVVAEILQQRLDEFDDAFKERLLLVNTALLISAGIASYVLSGISLKSIRENVESQEEFAADASHELRTPLTTISMEIVALQKTHKNIPKPVKETLQSIQQEVRRMQEIVNGLLTLVRNDRERASGKQVVDVNVLLAETLKQVQPLAHAQKVTLDATLSEKPVAVYISPDQMKQVLLIFLDNAIKYTPQRGRVNVMTEMKKRTVFVTIEDTGVGIPEADLPHIFDRFYRVRRLDRASAKGAGLGLTIANKLIEHARGSIKVASTMGVGTRVTVQLPKAS